MPQYASSVRRRARLLLRPVRSPLAGQRCPGVHAQRAQTIECLDDAQDVPKPDLKAVE